LACEGEDGLRRDERRCRGEREEREEKQTAHPREDTPPIRPWESVAQPLVSSLPMPGMRCCRTERAALRTPSGNARNEMSTYRGSLWTLLSVTNDVRSATALRTSSFLPIFGSRIRSITTRFWPASAMIAGRLGM